MIQSAPGMPVYDQKKHEVFEFKPGGSPAAGPDLRKAGLDVMEEAETKK